MKRNRSGCQGGAAGNQGREGKGKQLSQADIWGSYHEGSGGPYIKCLSFKGLRSDAGSPRETCWRIN